MDTKAKEKFINVNISVGEEANKLLNVAAKANKRSKRKEAAKRLEHHLKTYDAATWNEYKKYS
ncbi:TraY domain-containing protein [Photobacterium leiognathi]|uniref:TraY domain-containing protein n=1 Tax=Photobacterium leiognathi TaxID=553611 RepID=UPI0027389FAB|nr:TraY domain-containing protein [Photobacterium leiognathi]